MSEPTKLTLPASREELAELPHRRRSASLGMRIHHAHAGHQRALDALHATGKLPLRSRRGDAFYAGPTPCGRSSLRPVGPTTASRMDFATPALMKAGIVACIGKGKTAPPKW